MPFNERWRVQSLAKGAGGAGGQEVAQGEQPKDSGSHAAAERRGDAPNGKAKGTGRQGQGKDKVKRSRRPRVSPVPGETDPCDATGQRLPRAGRRAGADAGHITAQCRPAQGASVVFQTEGGYTGAPAEAGLDKDKSLLIKIVDVLSIMTAGGVCAQWQSE